MAVREFEVSHCNKSFFHLGEGEMSTEAVGRLCRSCRCEQLHCEHASCWVTFVALSLFLQKRLAPGLKVTHYMLEPVDRLPRYKLLLKGTCMQ